MTNGIALIAHCSVRQLGYRVRSVLFNYVALYAPLVNLVINIFLTINNWSYSAFRTCYMFKIRLKVTQNYIFAQLTNSF